ncbi:dienelactone hydrolase family protein [Bacillus sp. JJ722]|uniref:dienelactone hydrolase family protein n=1 Tax=Bacillus sp. JJ722 TaxID=3122973 RepID=UPI002FFE27AA
MIHIQNQSESLVIVIHEIYGLNAHMRDVCKTLSEQGYDVLCPNLLGSEDSFTNEEGEKAYNHFMKNIGFKKASFQVKEIVADMKVQYKEVWIIGFSIGAAIAWLCSEAEGVAGIVGFYGSRIRDYLHISPQCQVLLFFPQVEPSFQVDLLLSKLRKQTIECVKLEGLHGFMNPYSSNYHEQSAQTAFHKMLSCLSRI